MSDLTLALSLLGVLLLLGVVVHGAWQARKAGPKRAVAPAPPQAAPASRPSPGRTEPVLEDPPSVAPTIPCAFDLSSVPSELRPARRQQVRIDALLDAMAPITVETSLSGDLVLSHFPPTRRAGSKPFLIEGLNVDTREWETPVAGAQYSEFQAGVQLANRTGALNEIEYSEFVQKVQVFAEALGAMADFPDMLDVVARARELDAFAGQHDAQLAIHLRARSAAWSVGYIHQHAARHGFALGVVPGRLVLSSPDEGAPPVLTLSYDPQAALAEDPSQAAVRHVTVSFDVPQTEPQAEPFVAWQSSVQALALSMDADIVDDNGNPLSPQGFDAIGGELRQLYTALEGRDLGAGSMAARRLFS